MANSWLRLWHDMPNDPKWRTIARASKQSIPAVISVYIHLLVNASNAAERGRTQNVCNEDIASALDMDCEQIDQIILAMQGRVLDGDCITGWKKRQVEREDGAAERAKAWREAKKAQKEVETNVNETSANATERNRTQGERKQTPDKDTDTDKEIKPSCALPNGKCTDDAKNSLYTKSFLSFWELYPNRKNKGDAAKAFAKIKAAEYPDIRKGLEAAIASPDWRKDNGRFIPHPGTWLRARGWEDEGCTTGSSSKPFSLDDFYKQVGA